MRTTIRPIFYRLLLSYSLVGALPLAVAWLVILVWGNSFVMGYVGTIGKSFTERVATEVDEAVERFQLIGESLAADSAVLRGVNPRRLGPLQRVELDLYQRIYDEILGYLSVVEVHLTTVDGTLRFSSTEFPSRYDLTNHQLRDTYYPEPASSEPRLLLAPGPGSAGTQIAFGLWFPLTHGVLFLDVRTQALETPLQARTSSKIFLVNRRQFRSLNLLQPHDPTSFSAYPELGIVFTDDFTHRPTRYQLVHRRDLAAEDLSVIMITDLTTYFDTLRRVLLLGIALVAGTSVITLIVSIRISGSISRPIDSIIEAMTSNSQGPVPLPAADGVIPHDELEQLAFHYNRMVETIASLIQQVREEEQLLWAAERRALQAQIQPHFLYNTLGSIKSMAKLGDFAAVSTIVTDLGKILRFSLSDTDAMVALEQITDQVQRYLNIQKIRFQERMNVIIDLDPAAAQIQIPKLLIQPLAENAVVHGVERSPQPVTIRLATRLYGNVLEIRVEDTGPGLRVYTDPSEGFGIGLANVEKRLHLIYGGNTRFSLSREADRTVAMIRIEQ